MGLRQEEESPDFYFLKRLLKASRASFELRGACGAEPFSARMLVLEGSASRATVTRGEKSPHWLAASFTAIRSGIGFRH